MHTSQSLKNSRAVGRWIPLAALALITCHTTDGRAQVLQVQDDLELGLLDIAQIPGTARLGTNSSISYLGGLIGAGFGTAGLIRVTGKNGAAVDISCSTAATLSNGSDTIAVTSIEMVVGANAGTSPGGPGVVPCLGIGLTSVQLVAGNNNPNAALIGAALATTGTESGGSYDTSNSGGLPLFIEMVVP